MTDIRRVFRAVACAVTFSFASSVAHADELRLGSGFGDSHSSTRAMRDVFAPKVEELTGGRHTVSVFANSELGQAPEMVNQAQSGINFGVFVSSAFFNSQVPEIGVANMPFVFADRETAFKVFDGPFGETLKPLFEAKGLVVLGFMELGFRNVTNSVRPVSKPEDLQGLKIRLQNNPVHIATFNLLGASPTSIDASEMFAALSQGVVDGQENPYAVINSFRLYDAKQKYLTDTGHFFDVLVFAVSKTAFDAMSEEDRAAIVEAGRLATLEQRKYAAADEATNLEAVLSHGVELTKLTPEQRDAFRTATAPVKDEVKSRLGDQIVDDFMSAVQAAN